MILLEREQSGFRVSILQHRGGHVLTGQNASYEAHCDVAPDKVMDAFHHPCLYLREPDRFFKATEEVEESEVSNGPYVARHGGGFRPLFDWQREMSEDHRDHEDERDWEDDDE